MHHAPAMSVLRRSPLPTRRAGARGAPLAALAALGAAVLFAVVSSVSVPASSVLAADPSAKPTPMIFHNPQYLVWMEHHQTSWGPVVDQAYWLYVQPPDEDGHWAVPDGGGTVFHYWGHLVGGPFSGEADACPAMLAVGVTSLQAWIVAAGEEAQVADCSGYLATAAPAATAPVDLASAPPNPGSVGDGSGDLDDPEVDPEALGIAVMLIGALLFGGSAFAGIGSGAVPAPAGGPTATPTLPPEPIEPPMDPCAAQADAVAQASATGRSLNDLLASCRRYEELLQEQIDVLANLVLPGSVMLDLGFAAGGLSGGLGGVLGRKLIQSATFRAALGEAVAKDVIKELAKQALGSAGGEIDPARLEAEGDKSAIKQSILAGIKEGLINKRFFDSVAPDAPSRVFRTPGEYSKFLGEIGEYADSVAGPITEGMGALIDLYEGVTSGLELKDRLDNLRALRDRIADRRVDLEISFEDALGAHRFAADRLAHCREINAPGWRP